MITCPICNKQLKQLHGSHLKQHNISSREFKTIYPNVSLSNPSSKNTQLKLKLLREHEYMKNPTKCTKCNVIISYGKFIKRKSDQKSQQAKNLVGNIFCSRSCSASYNNTHKTYGVKKSKLEFYIEENLTKLYPTLEFHFNQKDTIDSELDIYVPLLKLGFEINGICHYEPIYGIKKLLEIQSNDYKKSQSCLEKGIVLCSINSSTLSYFKQSNAEPFLKIIRDVLDQQILLKNIDLTKLPSVPYNKQAKDTRLKTCKCCCIEFVYTNTSKQTFCSKDCLKLYRKNNSNIHKHILSHTKTIKQCLSEGLSILSIGKRIGFSNCGGGYYYAIKSVVKTLKEE